MLEYVQKTNFQNYVKGALLYVSLVTNLSQLRLWLTVLITIATRI